MSYIMENLKKQWEKISTDPLEDPKIKSGYKRCLNDIDRLAFRWERTIKV